jgi:ribonuclease III
VTTWDSFKNLEKVLQHSFADKDLLVLAMTHRSFEKINNERLEFLGDGFLGLAISKELYQRFPNISEGDLSRVRAQLVKESTLAEIATELNLGESLRLGEGELKSAGWRRPSLLADALEAIIGATFLDAGYDVANALVLRLFESRLASINPKLIEKDAKTMLQEYAQRKRLDVPSYHLLSVEGEAHCQTFHVECLIPALNIVTQGSGLSRRSAEQEAAKQALTLIGNQ